VAFSPGSDWRGTSRAGSPSGCCSPRRRSGIVGYALAGVPLAGIAVILTVALEGMNISGGVVDLVGLYTLAALVNFCGFFWAGGIAMRFRTIQAGPLMQMPVFLILFFAPVYVPLELLEGWIHGVATVNPVTYLLETGRGFVAGDAPHIGGAFAIAIGGCLLDLGLPRPAQGRGCRRRKAPTALFGLRVLRTASRRISDAAAASIRCITNAGVPKGAAVMKFLSGSGGTRSRCRGRRCAW
jgi:hypothetical protein